MRPISVAEVASCFAAGKRAHSLCFENGCHERVVSRRKDVEKRLEKLLEEILIFKNAIEDCDQRKEANKAEIDDTMKEYEEKIEIVRKEIEVAENLLGQLNERVKDAEEQIAEEKGRITEFQEKRLPSEYPMRPQTKRIGKEEVLTPWPPNPVTPVQPSPPLTDHEYSAIIPSDEKVPASSRPRNLSLRGLSNVLARRPAETPAHASTLPLPVSSAQMSGSDFFSRFSPFDPEQEATLLSPGAPLTSPISPGVSMSLIPSGIMDTPTTLDNEALFDMPPARVSPTAINGDGDERAHIPLTIQSPEVSVPELRFDYSSNSPVQTSPVPSYQQRYEVFDSQRVIIKPPSRESFEPAEPYSLSTEDRSDSTGIKSRRWFSKDKSEDNEKEALQKGLNPDAKIFKFTRKNPFLSLSTTSANGELEADGRLIDRAPRSIDPLNPSGPPPMPPPPTPRTSFFSSLRAFQPSPAEREALRLAMVSSANNSLERINSSGTHQGGNSSYSPPATSSGSPLVHGPFIGSPGPIPRSPNSHPQSLQGQGRPDAAGAFGARNPWIMASNHSTSHSLDALAAATVKAVNGEGSTGNSSFASAPPHKKTFSFNPWGGDKFLESK